MKHLFVFLLLFISTYSCNSIPPKETIVIAHRGASGYLPEHTLESYSLAYGQGANFIEADVVLTKDDKAVILHDIYLESTTNIKDVFPKRKRSDGHFYAIDFTLAEIKNLRAGERKNNKSHKQVFPKRFPASVRIFTVPTLVEFLELIKGLNKSGQKTVGIYPELKRPEFHRQNKKDITKIVYNLLKEYGYENKPQEIFIQSFDAVCLKRLKNTIKTNIPLIQLISKKNMVPLNLNSENLSLGLVQIKKYADGIGSSYKKLLQKNKKGQWQKSSLAKLAKEKGLLLHPYTLRADDIPKEFSSFDNLVQTLVMTAHVDGFFSDFTDKTKQALAKI